MLVLFNLEVFSLGIISTSGEASSSPGRFLGISYKSFILTKELKLRKVSSCFSSIKLLLRPLYNINFSCSFIQFPNPLVLSGDNGSFFSL